MFNTPKKKITALCIVFAVIYFAHGISGSLYTIYQVHLTGVFATHDFLGWYHILTTVLVAAVYLPLSVQIRRLANDADMRGLKGFSTFIVVALSVFTVLNTIAIIIGLIFPGLVG